MKKRGIHCIEVFLVYNWLALRLLLFLDIMYYRNPHYKGLHHCIYLVKSARLSITQTFCSRRLHHLMCCLRVDNDPNHPSLVYSQVPFIFCLSFAVVVVLTLNPATEVQVEEDAGTVDLTITAPKPAECPYNVTIGTMAGTAEG